MWSQTRNEADNLDYVISTNTNSINYDKLA